MDGFRDRIDWAEEVRRFTGEKVRELEAEENFRKVLSKLEKANWGVPKGFSAEVVREDRDSV
uniref:CopG family transcriptional regulator n=1 Tax=Ignisphaera aggregans TaxID=334771 RepID=A0A7J2TAC6_9CREN